MLLDTNIIIWSLTSPNRLGKITRDILLYTEKLNVSVASQLEIAIKERLGRFEFLEISEAELNKQNITQVPISIGQLRQLAALKHLKHRDPFDLLIIALAIERQLTLITADRTILAMNLPNLRTLDARQ